MIAKRFLVPIANDADCLFIISNCCEDTDHDEITVEELKLPALRLEPVSCSNVEEFWQSFESIYIDEAVHPDIIQALQGKHPEWKVIRCSAESIDGAFITLVNPDLYQKYLETDNPQQRLGKGYVEDMKIGLVDVFLPIGCDLLRVTVMKQKKSGKLKKHATYKVSRKSSVCVELVEYKRHSWRSTSYSDVGLEIAECVY